MALRDGQVRDCTDEKSDKFESGIAEDSVMFAGMGWAEILIIVVILSLLFGSDRMSQIAKSVARGVNEIRKVKEDIEEDIGIAQVRRLKSDVMREVKDTASSMTTGLVDLGNQRYGKPQTGNTNKT